MNPRNARLLDDLLAKTNGRAIYQFLRGGHTSDVAELLGGLERRMHLAEAREALINFAWMMIEARPLQGADESRRRDKIAERAMAELKRDDRTARGLVQSHRRNRP